MRRLRRWRKVDRLFGQVTIVGVGLIGGSLGLALKSAGFAKKIVGVSRQQASLNAALAKGSIDSGLTDISVAVADADMVVLCTPLSTYGPLTQLMQPHLKQGAIITDAGSVKVRPTEVVLAELSSDQRAFFVPGHPIAGTENSGPEAAFSTLYRHKKVILTPSSKVNTGAIQAVTAMWRAVGADVDQLDAVRHDSMYATSSHLVQLLSSLFMTQVAAHDAVRENVDDWFRQFIRLAGSDTTMWRDIFVANHAALAGAVMAYSEHLQHLIAQIESASWSAVAMRLVSANAKRRHFYTLLKKRLPDAPELQHREIGYVDGDPAVWMDCVPRLLACALIELLPEADYDYATGSGLHGFTQPLLYVGAVETVGLERHAEQIGAVLRRFDESLCMCIDVSTQPMLDAAKIGYDDWRV